MLMKFLPSALVLLAAFTSAAPVAEADADLSTRDASPLEMYEVGTLDTPNSLLSHILPRSHHRRCSKGVRVWGLRGSTAIRGQNSIATMAHEIASWAPHSFGSDLPYPALTNANLATYFADSVDVGVTMIQNRIKHYTERCPGHRIVLIGFSQGAQVLGNALIGSNEAEPGLAPQYRGAIKAIVQFADPAYTPGLSFDTGSPTSRTRGATNRLNYQRYAQYGFAGKMKSYCDAGDRYCSCGSGPYADAIHGSTPATHGEEAVAWIKSKLRADGI